MKIPTEPIGSIPRSPQLVAVITGATANANLPALYNETLKNTITSFEETGSPVISDGEQTKSSFATYPLEGLTKLTAEGMTINFEDGHSRHCLC